jgi:hypothetical protein
VISATCLRETFRQFLCAGFAVPLLKRLVRDFSFDKELGELPPLRLALEWASLLSTNEPVIAARIANVFVKLPLAELRDL